MLNSNDRIWSGGRSDRYTGMAGFFLPVLNAAATAHAADLSEYD
ncbi:MAG: hypothetical protein RQ936_09920 [Gammaproteobacteria bacterium]|nr:hypothetical protein [Gammaproteobacteria bacterium]